MNPYLHLAVFRTCRTNRIAVSSTAQPDLSVSLAKAGQRGRAGKHTAQWRMLCGFLGTAWRTVLLLCQASLYCRGPLGCSLPGHSRGWKGISLGFNWKDATLNSANASILYSWTVVAEFADGRNGRGRAHRVGQITAQNHSATQMVHKSWGGSEEPFKDKTQHCPTIRVSRRSPQAMELKTFWIKYFSVLVILI